jgi:hypothetical protein
MESIKKPSATRPLPLLSEPPKDLYSTHIMNRSQTLRHLLSEIPGLNTEAIAAPTRIKLFIRGIPEYLTMTEGQIVLVGRADFRSRGFHPDLDLTRYGAHERGVSRAHARLHIQEGKLYITDFYSANGTHVRGNRLQPEQPTELHNGDDLVLGALCIRVQFE